MTEQARKQSTPPNNLFLLGTSPVFIFGEIQHSFEDIDLVGSLVLLRKNVDALVIKENRRMTIKTRVVTGRKKSKPVRSGRCKLRTGPVRPVTGRSKILSRPVKTGKNRPVKLYSPDRTGYNFDNVL